MSCHMTRSQLCDTGLVEQYCTSDADISATHLKVTKQAHYRQVRQKYILGLGHFNIFGQATIVFMYLVA